MTTAPYQRHSTTSQAGALAVAPYVGSQRERIKTWLQANGPSTRSEISEALGIRINAVCGRVNALIKDGELEVHFVRYCLITSHMAEAVGLRVEPVQGALL